MARTTPLTRTGWTVAIWLGLATFWPGRAASQAEPDVSRQLAVLDKFVGTWDVTVRVKRPKVLVVTYTERATWGPGRRWLNGDTGTKSDGNHDWSMTGFDQASGGYPVWIYSSTGAWYQLAPGKWDEATQTIEWKGPPVSPVSHLSRCRFADARTKHCTTLVKDWKGAVLLEQEITATRRGP